MIADQKKLAVTSLILSLGALLVSAITLYQTFLKKPNIIINTIDNWHYLRGDSVNEEQLLIPVSLTNTGAIEATVTSLSATIKDKSHKTRIWHGRYLVSQDTMNRVPLAPISIPGRSSFTGLILFSTNATDAALIESAGSYEIELYFQYVFPGSRYGFGTDAVTTRKRLNAIMTLENFSISTLMGSRKGLPLFISLTNSSW